MQNVFARTTGLSLDGSLFNPARAPGNWHLPIEAATAVLQAARADRLIGNN